MTGHMMGLWRSGPKVTPTAQHPPDRPSQIGIRIHDRSPTQSRPVSVPLTTAQSLQLCQDSGNRSGAVHGPRWRRGRHSLSAATTPTTTFATGPRLMIQARTSSSGQQESDIGHAYALRSPLHQPQHHPSTRLGLPPKPLQLRPNPAPSALAPPPVFPSPIPPPTRVLTSVLCALLTPAYSLRLGTNSSTRRLGGSAASAAASRPGAARLARLAMRRSIVGEAETNAADALGAGFGGSRSRLGATDERGTGRTARRRAEGRMAEGREERVGGRWRRGGGGVFG